MSLEKDTLSSRRVLVIGDHAELGEQLRDILKLGSTKALQLECAPQGQQGLVRFIDAQKADRPFTLAFVDAGTGPNWAGVETVHRLRRQDPDLPIVLTAPPAEDPTDQIVRRIGRCGELLLLHTPFDPVELRHATASMIELRRTRQQARERIKQLEGAVQTQSSQLKQLNSQLKSETELRAGAEQQLKHNSLYDVLTNLPNRTLLSEHIQRCIYRSQRRSEYLFSVIYLDVDNFKLINDGLGHRTGDELLQQLAERLRSDLRSVDVLSRTSEETAARIGGDEFVILLDGIEKSSDATVVAERLQRTLGKPIELEGHQLVISVSIGIAGSEHGYDQAGEILRDADTALHQAKLQGRNHCVMFDRQMHVRALARLNAESELHQAVRDGSLTTQFQPIVRIADSKIEAIETLVRWQRSPKVSMAPAELIEIAEETGMIVPVGEWVLRQACQKLQQWKQQFKDYPNLSISVNLSSTQLSTKGFIDQIDHILAESGLDPRCLNLELTEGVIVQNAGQAAEALKALNKRGVALHIDDFGTGYSSLSYLHSLPIAAVKLDRSFIQQMSLGEEAPTIQAVIALARSRNIRVIAEGVENADQISQLQALGCDLAQGYYFSESVDADAIAKMLAEGGSCAKIA